MEAQYFVYTRGHDIANDYKLLFSPSEDFCPSDVRKFFLTQVRGLINIDAYAGNLEKNPRWILSKKNGFTLWGVGTMNKILSDRNNSDYANRDVRGFFGFVVKGSSVSALPFDLSFFTRFYSNYIVDLWNVPKDEFKRKGVSVIDSFDGCKLITAGQPVVVPNLDEGKTQIWEDSVSPEDFFSAVLDVNADFTCVYGLEEKGHAFDHKYRYSNVIVRDVNDRELKTYTAAVIGGDITLDGNVPVEEYQEVQKKDYRLKLIAFLGSMAALMAMALIIGRCSKSGQPNLQKSVSGDSIQSVKAERNK